MNSIKKLFIALFGLFSFSSHATMQAQSAPQPEPPQNTHSQEQNTRPKSCKDYLHKVTDLDDLIRQMFQTGLFDNCLYDMTPEELHRIWGIPVLPDKGYDYRASQSDFGSPFNFFVQFDVSPDKKLNWLAIALNKKGFEQDGTLFPNGKFPDFLPDPSIVENWYFHIELPGLGSSKYIANPDAKIQPEKIYYWVNNTLGNTYADGLSVETHIGTDGIIWQLIFRKGYSNFFNLPVYATQFKENTDN